MNIDYDKVPVEYMRDTVRMYIEKGYNGGSFLTSLFSNDLTKTYMLADEENGAAIKQWVLFLFNTAPAGCWGSKEHVKDWIKDGGLVGHESDKVT